MSPVARASSVQHQSSTKSALDVTSSALTTTNVNSNIATIRGGDDEDASLSLLARFKIGGYFGLWYILNVVYNSEYMVFVLLSA